LYETLILRDILFYFLPGGFTLFGLSIVFWTQIPDSWKNTIATYAPLDGWFTTIILFAMSYITGHVLYIIHNGTVGKLKAFKRHEIMGRFLELSKAKNDVSGFTQKVRKGLLNAVGNDGSQAKVASILKSENLLQIYFTADKYIRYKSMDLYTLYVSRLTATSRFYGVMSVGWALLGLACTSLFFTTSLPSVLNVAIIFMFFILSYRFVKQSIAEQEELVWNVLQATYLLDLKEREISEQNKKPSSKNTG
jgi:hypothetical protein